MINNTISEIRNDSFKNTFFENNDFLKSPLLPYINYHHHYFDGCKITLPDEDYINADVYPNQIKDFLPKDIKSTTNNKYENIPDLYNANDILNIVNNGVNRNKIKSFFENVNFKDIKIDIDLINKKRKKDFDFFNFYELNQNNIVQCEIKKNKRGRKTNKCDRLGLHNKMCSDNIIKKIKAYIFKYSLNFLNNILKRTTNIRNEIGTLKILRLDYKYVDKMKKSQELEILNMKLKNFFSKKISPKYHTIKSDYNQRIIQKIECILKEKPDDTLLFALNMTLRDWLEVFTLKKLVKDIINEHKEKNDIIDINYNNIDSKKIAKDLVGIKDVLTKIKNKNNDDYLNHFIIYLYNYERWFYLRGERKSYKNNNIITNLDNNNY